MIVWRRWVFPILMVIVFGVIAASLAKLAFFSAPEQTSVSPGGEVTDPIVVVETGTIVNELSLSGTIARDADVTVRSNATGTVTSVKVKDGATVKKGQVLLTVRQDYPAAIIEVKAPEAGRLAGFAILNGQDLGIGTEVSTLVPDRYHVLATVEPVQLYRLLDAPSEAEVSITGGPAPFACTKLATAVSDAGTTSVTCSVPRDQVVFPGLPATLQIAVGTAEDVLMIPTTAVKGGAGSGVVWLVGPDGVAIETPVELGVSDGFFVEVLNGLDAGAEIREFVPGAAAPVEEFCYEIAPGEEYCETGTSW